MPWSRSTVSDQRCAFVSLARSGECSFAEACRRFGVSRPTGYKWLARAGGAPGSPLDDRPRRPKVSPGRTAADVEAAVLEVRDRFGWGAREIHAFLRDRRGPSVPARTISAILARSGRTRRPAAPAAPPQRFERAEPNQLWQVDFKGPLELAGRRRCCLLSVLDDHSRYLLALEVVPDKTMATAWDVLWGLFGEVGLPERVLADNGFACPGPGGRAGLSWFDARLVRLGIGASHGRPYHPQTQGKVERFHRTLAEEAPRTARRDDERSLAEDLRAWRVGVYDAPRPHEALGYRVPAGPWRPGARHRPRELPEVSYAAGVPLRKVMGRGEICWRGHEILVGAGIAGERVRVEEADGEVRVYSATRLVRAIRLEQLCKGGIM